MTSAAAELRARDRERDRLLERLAKVAETLRAVEADREELYASRLVLYRQLKELGTIHAQIASAAGVSETAISLALKPKATALGVSPTGDVRPLIVGAWRAAAAAPPRSCS